MAEIKAQQQQQKSSWSSRGKWFYRLAVVVRYARIPVLVLGVYSLGYQQGIMDCTKTPKMLQEKILNTVLVGQGVTDMSHVHVVGEWEIKKFTSDRHHGVALIGQKIIKAAREHVHEKLVESMAKVRERLPDDMPESVLNEHYRKDEACDFWYEAGVRLVGEGEKPWQFVFIKTGLPNAFVTEMLPQRFFMTTGLLDLADSHDELAFVLGHEVSHLVLGHVSQANQFETMLRTVEVLLLSIDPTSGVLALFVIGGLAALRRVLSAAHSRDKEREADDLGLQIAARACFDTEAGVEMMKKMYHLSTLEVPLVSGTSTKVAHLYDSHPPSQERYESLKLQAQEHNKDKYTHCHGVVRRLFTSMFQKSKKDIDVEDAEEQMAREKAAARQKQSK